MTGSVVPGTVATPASDGGPARGGLVAHAFDHVGLRADPDEPGILTARAKSAFSARNP